MNNVLELSFKLLLGHILGDFVVQSDTMLMLKNRHNRPPSFLSHSSPNWIIWLSAHSLVHAGFVYAITNSLPFAVFEYCFHTFIDFIKCEDLIDAHVDQFLHILTKILIIYLIYRWV